MKNAPVKVKLRVPEDKEYEGDVYYASVRQRMTPVLTSFVMRRTGMEVVTMLITLRSFRC